jgi:hypothetical protein
MQCYNFACSSSSGNLGLAGQNQLALHCSRVEAKARQHRSVPLRALALEVFEDLCSLVNEDVHGSPIGVIVPCCLQVLVEVADSESQYRGCEKTTSAF